MKKVMKIFLFLFLLLSALRYPLSVAEAAVPTTGAISPSSGSSAPDTAKTFSAAYSDFDGWQNLKEAYFLVSSGPAVLANAVLLYYDQNTNKLYLRDDANTAWLGGFAPGSANTIENAQVKLDCVLTAVSGSAETLAVAWSLMFKPFYSGKAYNLYLLVKDDTGASSSIVKAGVFAVTYPPVAGAVIPASGSGFAGLALDFATAYSDPDGWQNIQFAALLINTSTASSNSFCAYYDQNSNKFYLRNDADTLWVGGFSPGSANVIENSYAQLDCVKTIVSGEAQTLTIQWAVSFKPAFIGVKNSYLYVKDDFNLVQGWVKKGVWTIAADITPPSLSITSPQDQSIVESDQLMVSGTAQDNVGVASVSVNGQPATTTDNYAAWSAEVLLTSGANTIAILAQDQAGNTTSSSITVTYNAGTLIGIEGGEVVSSDGKVKLVISAAALTEPVYIKINTVNKDNLSSLTPQNTSLLSVVECKPYGLVFNKPSQIIYTLDTAEIPGTPVELGLFDSIQNTITATGQKSTIPVDGYSVTFSILHFSTYTALKNLTPQSTPIGSAVKIPLPDLLTGAFSHSIPISVPPGRKGMQPALGLTYRSAGANSWVGLGFSLNPGYIARSTRLGPATYNDSSDTFYLITDAGTTELVHLIDNLYQAKVESSFTKFFKETDDSWRVLAKDGSKLFFGQTAYAREAGSGGTFSWSLTRAQDTNGNYLTYVYTQDQGKSYLSRIDYTAHESGISAANSVDFLLEPRSDISSSYISGNRVAIVKRLKTIEVKQGADLVWRYNLEYTPSTDTNRSLLTRVTQSVPDGTVFPAQELTYQKNKS